MWQWLKALIAKIKSWFKKPPTPPGGATKQDGPGPWRPS